QRLRPPRIEGWKSRDCAGKANAPPERRAGTTDSRMARRSVGLRATEARSRHSTTVRSLHNTNGRAKMSSMSDHNSGSQPSDAPRRAARRPRADGLESRRTILHAAANLATTRGLEGLSIGELAEHIGMSKSGLYAHFKSKEELELATIE